MVARCAAAAPVLSANFVLWNTLEKGQVKHFLFLNRQTGEGGGQQLVIKNDRIAADGERIFPAEIVICGTEWVILFFCEVYSRDISLWYFLRHVRKALYLAFRITTLQKAWNVYSICSLYSSVQVMEIPPFLKGLC